MLGFLAAAILAIACLATLAKLRPSFTRVRPEFRSAASAGLSALAPRPGARWIVTGMMGSGKSTLAKTMSARWGQVHVQIDDLSEEQVLDALNDRGSSEGWIAEANPWHIPTEAWEHAEMILFLDYDNAVNYVRLLSRSLTRWRSSGFSLRGFRHHVIDYALRTLCRIVYLHGEDNRRGWRDNGIAPADANTDRAILLRCVSPAETKLLFETSRPTL